MEFVHSDHVFVPGRYLEYQTINPSSLSREWEHRPSQIVDLFQEDGQWIALYRGDEFDLRLHIHDPRYLPRWFYGPLMTYITTTEDERPTTHMLKTFHEQDVEDEGYGE